MEHLGTGATSGYWEGLEPRAVVLRELDVRCASPQELGRVARLLGQEHFLGAGRAVGRTLVQVVHHRERWVAILVWGPAALKLSDREQWVGWNAMQRAARIGLSGLTATWSLP